MDPASDPGQIIAFYSFKGGTGRSMALANVGYSLAQNRELNKPVLLIDWDLEAPGLHRYFRKQLSMAFRGSEEVQEKSPGLIDLFIELRDRIKQLRLSEPQQFDSAMELLARVPIDEYVIKTDIARLHLLKAGRFDDGYAERITTFDWSALYRESPFLLRAFAAQLGRHYQYVLIDSRTGLTDTSSICTMLLPEILVTVFTPNRQSLSGVIDLIEQAGRYRLESEDLRPLVVYPLPSRIEASEPALRQQWRHGDKKAGIDGFQPAFEKAFESMYGIQRCDLTSYFDDVQIQHVPKYAYGEELAVVVEETQDRFSLTRSFDRFTVRLLEGEPPWLSSGGNLETKLSLDESSITLDRQSAQTAREAENLATTVDQRIEKLQLGKRIFDFTGGLFLALVAILAFIFGDKFNSGLGLIGIGSAFEVGISLTALVMASLVQWLLSSQKATIASYITSLEQEKGLFREGRAPYDDMELDKALSRYARRLAPMLAGTRGIGWLLPRKFQKFQNREPNIVISYRRSDASEYARRVYAALSSRFGPRSLTIDVNSIEPGQDFRRVIEWRINSADVMLVIIGPNWVRGFQERKFADHDWITWEIAAALRQKILTIPVLVNDARMPLASELPEEIRSLAYLNAANLNDRKWDADIARLVEAIDRVSFGLQLPG